MPDITQAYDQFGVFQYYAQAYGSRFTSVGYGVQLWK